MDRLFKKMFEIIFECQKYIHITATAFSWAVEKNQKAMKIGEKVDRNKTRPFIYQHFIEV